MFSNRARHLACCAVLFAGSAEALAATAPYTETFQDGLAQDFVTGSAGSPPTSSFTVAEPTTGNFVYRHTMSSTAGTGASGLSSVQLTNVPTTVGTSFTITTTAKFVTAPDSSVGGAFGFRFLGSTSSSNNDSYIADVSASDGAVRIVEFNGGTADTSFSTNSKTGTVAVGNTYNLTLTGTYVSGGLNLSFTATGPSYSATATSTITDASPKSGQFFGYRDNVGSGGGTNRTLTVEFDEFNVVPEPTTLSLVGVGAVGLLARRRRRAR